jgi:hypothetical protein
MTIYRDDLERVYALIEKPENWTQEYYARDAGGDPICDVDGELIESPMAANADEAACWCLWGAAYKCGIPESKDQELATALAFDFPSSVADFNDTHSHAEVLARLRRAIDRAPVRP